ncbi:MAG: Zinc transporter ZupT [Thermoanaerobaculia bacterium]|nr:Zinc transporter ZupT [Thermoanaerobaculia bacterium]
MGLLTAFVITIHSFPEGLATFVASLHDAQLGVAIAIAGALHNIPGGISVSVPIFYATGFVHGLSLRGAVLSAGGPP